jgi:hypothetical protein
MKLRFLPFDQLFEAELTDQHPKSITGALALKRTDTGTYIALHDIFSLPDCKYAIIESTPLEQERLDQVGIVLFGSQCYPDMDKETKEAIIAELQEHLKSSQTIASRIMTIQINHRQFLPLLGDLRPLADASEIVREELKKMIERMKSRK